MAINVRNDKFRVLGTKIDTTMLTRAVETGLGRHLVSRCSTTRRSSPATRSRMKAASSGRRAEGCLDYEIMRPEMVG